MAETLVVDEEVVEEKEFNPMLEAARKVLLASIGAVALAQDEVEGFVNKLIERGEIAEKDGRKLVRDVMERRKKKAEETARDAEDKLEKRVQDLLERMNVPTKSDIEALSEKITMLTRKVDELKKAQPKA